MNFKIIKSTKEYNLTKDNTPEERKSLIEDNFNKDWWSKESVDDFINGYINKVNFRKLKIENNTDITLEYASIEREKSKIELEKEKILKARNKTKRQFMEEVNTSRVEKIRFLLTYMFSDKCSVYRFDRLVQSFYITKGTINSQPTYTLVLDNEVLGEVKGKKQEIEKLFKSIGSTINKGQQCEIKTKGRTYFLDTKRDVVSKLETGDYLSETEIASLLTETNLVLKKEYTDKVTSVIKVNNNLYAVDWNKEESKPLGQPYKCEIETTINILD